MKVEVITKRQIRKSYKGCQTFADLINNIEKKYERNGDVICGIKVNGQVITSEEEAGLSLSGVSFIEEVEVKVQNSTELIFETMKTLLGYMSKLSREAKEIARLFRTQNEHEGMIRFAEYVSASEWVNDSLLEIREAFNKKKMTLRSASLWSSTEQTFISVLKAITGAFEVRDYVLLADLLEYEVPEVLDHWREVVSTEINNRSSKKELISEASID